MKKIFYIALISLAFTSTFTSCEEDEDFGNSNYEIVSNPAEAVEGTYSGTWTRTLNGTEETVEGSITLQMADDPNYVNVKFDDELSIGVNAVTVKSNIAQQGDRFIITNNVASNAQGTSFRIYVENGKLTINFMKTIKSGRLSYDYSYTFEGFK